MTVSPDLLRLLARPPSFIPTPADFNHRLVYRHLIDFLRRLHWRIVFAARQSSNADSDPCRFGTYSSSSWPSYGQVPPSVHRISKRILSAAASVLRTTHSCFSDSNLDHGELSCLSLVRSDPRLVVRPADKGGRWVLMDADSYSHECRRQLCNPTFYQPLSSPLPVSSYDPSPDLVQLCRSGYISRRELRFLLPPASPRSRRFGILPKIHKAVWPEPCMPPGRPIVADVNSVNSGTARLLDFFLQPIVQSQSSYLRDSQHLLAILHPLRLTDSSLLATFDVRALYTSIPLAEGVRRIERAFLHLPDPTRPSDVLLRLLTSSLLHNDFQFEDTSWLQVKGVAMGKAFGGAFASIYLGEWEREALHRSPLLPTLWRRFQDDILVIWDHGLESLLTFRNLLNGLDTHISVDINHHSDHIRFLDLDIYRKPGGSLGYRIGFKDTDCHRILPHDSRHASHVHSGVIYSQILRWAAKSSSFDDFRSTYSTVFPLWRLQGVSRSLIRRCLRRVYEVTNLNHGWSPGFCPCDGNRCRACSTAAPCSVFKDYRSSQVFPILFNFSCDTSHCIYVIFCSSCHILYVGQTSNPVRVRINEHLRNVTSRSSSSSPLVASHFNDVCDPGTFRWCVIDRCFSTERRLQKESKWIRALRSKHPLGLNTTTNQAPKRLNLVTLPGACTDRLNSTVRSLCRSELNIDVRLSYTTHRNLSSLFKT